MNREIKLDIIELGRAYLGVAIMFFLFVILEWMNNKKV